MSPISCQGDKVRQVNPPKLVVVRHDDGWHNGTLSAWQKLDGRDLLRGVP